MNPSHAHRPPSRLLPRRVLLALALLAGSIAATSVSSPVRAEWAPVEPTPAQPRILLAPCQSASDLDCIESIGAYINGNYVDGTLTGRTGPDASGGICCHEWQIPGLVNEDGLDLVESQATLDFPGIPGRNAMLGFEIHATTQNGFRPPYESGSTACTTNKIAGVCVRYGNTQQNIRYQAVIRTSWLLPSAITPKAGDVEVDVERLSTSGASKITVSGIPYDILGVDTETDVDDPDARGAWKVNRFAFAILDTRYFGPAQHCAESPTFTVADNSWAPSVPTFDPATGKLSLRIGNPHYDTDGTTVWIGKYQARIPLETARCMWGPSIDENTEFSFEIVDPDDPDNVATTNVTVVDEVVVITATNFHYSTPTLSVTAESSFQPVTPLRIMDTRDGTGGVMRAKVGNGTNDQGVPLVFDVRGKGGLPTEANQITAVSLNVTAANTTVGSEGGWVAVYPCGTTPGVSNLNFVSGQITPNAVITPVSAQGTVCFKVYGRADLIVDVNGWYPPGSGLTAVSPSRIMDTRNGTGGVAAAKVGNGTNEQGATLTFDVRGKGGLPTDASTIGAVSLNVTAANTTVGSEGGWVAAYPCGTTPGVSNLNFASGQITPNAVITPVSAQGTICFKVYGRADLIVDVNGWFESGSGFTPVTPSRIMDTRDGTGGIAAAKVGNGTNEQGATLTFDVRGKGGVPATASDIGAVSLNVTAANTTVGNEGGWVAVYPCGTTPGVSNLNFVSGQITPNAVITPVSAQGTICFKVYGRADLIVDVNGWFAA